MPSGRGWYTDVIMSAMASRIAAQPHHCLLNRLQIKEKIKTLRHWPLCGDFPTQMSSNAENVSIWWRVHDCSSTSQKPWRTKQHDLMNKLRTQIYLKQSTTKFLRIYWRSGSSAVQAIACRQFHVEPLTKPMGTSHAAFFLESTPANAS